MYGESSSSAEARCEKMPAMTISGKRKQVFERVDELVRLEAKTVEVGVDLHVDGARAAGACALRHRPAGRTPWAPQRELDVGGQRVVESFGRNRPEDEHRRRDPAGAQRDGLFERVDAKARRERLDRARDRHQAVPVGVALHDEGCRRAPTRSRSSAGVMAQRAQGNLEAADHGRRHFEPARPLPAYPFEGCTPRRVC